MTTHFPLRKRHFLALVLALSLGFGLNAAAQAQVKIALVDLQKLFEGYYKTKQADAQLRERGAEAEKQFKSMLEDYQKANDEYKKLVESANDQAVSSEERDRRKKSAEGKVLELNDIEKSLTQYRREKQSTFDDQKLRMRDQILREIREVVNAKARAGNYTLVVDVSAKSASQVPIILFSAGQNDLTDDVLAQINLPAPPGLLDADNKSPRGDLKFNLPEPEKEKEKPSKGTKK